MASKEVAEHKLKLAEVLDMLVADGMVGKEDSEALFNERHLRRHDDHPLVIIAGKAWRSRIPPQRILTLDT